MMQNTSLECSTSPAVAARRTAARKMDCVRPASSMTRGRQIDRTDQQPASETRTSKSAVGKPEDFTCSSCWQTFPSKFELLMHVFIHMVDVKPPMHVCRLCAEVFASRRSLHMHLKARGSQCTVAKKGIRALRSCNRRKTFQNLQSIQCSRDTQSSFDGLIQQTEIYMSQPERTDSERYQTHISIDHTQPKYEQTDTQARPGTNACEKRNTSLRGHYAARLKQHALERSVKHLFKCNSCDRYFKYRVHLQQHAASHRKKLFLCNHCDRTFKRPVDLRQHRLSHTGEKPHMCECGKSFAKLGSLKRHERVHRGERPYTCKVCFKSFTDASVLKNHAVVHTGERAYVCAHCGKAFKERGHLRRHLLLHTGEKPYVCRVCGTSFNQSATLTTHMRLHTGEKPYKCETCFKTFSDRSNWRVHSKTHKWAICEKRFVVRHDLVLNTNPECSTSPVVAAQRTSARKIDSVRPTGCVRHSHQINQRGQQPASVTRGSGSAGGESVDFTCSSCVKTFPSKYELLLHVFSHMDDVKPPLHVCRLCGEVFASRRSLQVHSKTKGSKCTVAKKGNGGLGSSNRRKTCQKRQSIQWSRDTQSFSEGSFQQTEMCTSQPERADSDRYQTNIPKDITLPKYKQSNTQEGQGSNAGDKCNTLLMSTAHLKQRALERSVQLPFKCNSCDRYFRYKGHLQRHAASHRKKLFLCNHCDRTFKRPVDLRQHRLSHTGEKPHVCKCGKSFAKLGSLKRHERVHRGERPYTCKVCFKSFTDASVLKNHAVVHTGERAYVCVHCDKAFKERGHLRRHLLLHTGEKPYVCRVCGTSFNQSATLTTHMRLHTGEKPYKCETCFKTFSDRSNWRVHSKTHKWAICEKRFVERHDLVLNTNPECSTSPVVAPQQTSARKTDCMRPTGCVRHSHRINQRGQQPASVTRGSGSAGSESEDFTCSSCWKTFPSKYELLLHVFIHMDDVKPPLHVCRLCGEVFASRPSLLLHSKTKDSKCMDAKKGNRGLGSSNR